MYLYLKDVLLFKRTIFGVKIPVTPCYATRDSAAFHVIQETGRVCRGALILFNPSGQTICCLVVT